eukprot:1540446-Amphidinium_carterae.1
MESVNVTTHVQSAYRHPFPQCPSCVRKALRFNVLSVWATLNVWCAGMHSNQAFSRLETNDMLSLCPAALIQCVLTILKSAIVQNYRIETLQEDCQNNGVAMFTVCWTMFGTTITDMSCQWCLCKLMRYTFLTSYNWRAAGHSRYLQSSSVILQKFGCGAAKAS